jgi:hypothetical protein
LLGLLLLQGVEDGFGGLAVGQGAGIETDGGGLAIEGFALAVEFLDGAAGVGGLEERAFALFDPLVELFRAGVEPDHGADLREKFTVFLRDDNPAAGGDDQADAADQTLQDFGFERAEVVFAVLLEDRGDGLSGFLRNKGIGIDEGEAGERREESPDAGFAGAHESDEGQVTKHVQIFTTFKAFGPRSLGLSSNSTVSPSSSVLKPSPRISE